MDILRLLLILLLQELWLLNIARSRREEAQVKTGTSVIQVFPRPRPQMGLPNLRIRVKMLDSLDL